MTDTASTRLAACPFCGGEANIVRTMLPTPINESWGVSCNNTGLCQASIDCQATEAEAIAAWNKRTPPSQDKGEALAEELERLREEVDRFRRPRDRALSTEDPITPLDSFQPRHLLGLALLFRQWCDSDLWGRPEEAELAAQQVETAYSMLNALSTTQASERKQIVAWLRASGHSDPGAFAQRAYATAFADAIERGDYLATPVEQPAQAEVFQRAIDQAAEAAAGRALEAAAKVAEDFADLNDGPRTAAYRAARFTAQQIATAIRSLAALKTRTSPETTFADELAERVRRAFSNDAAALITGELSDGRRYVVMPFDHYESELLKRQKRGAEQALRTSPETEASDGLVEEIERRFGKGVEQRPLDWQTRDRILAALKTRTSKPGEPLGLLDDGMCDDHGVFGCKKCLASLAASRTSPETVELLKETRGTMAEQVRRCEGWGKSHHEMDAAISAIDAHLSNTPDQGSDQHG